MSVEKIELKSKGRRIAGLKCGNGSVPCIIVGPGSFYFGKLSNKIKDIMTFYTFDEEWSCNKGEVSTQNIKAVEFKNLIDKTKDIVRLLKAKYKYNKIGLTGFSAPGLIALGAGAVIGPESISFVIGSGIATTPLDPKFTETTKYFEENAEKERKLAFNRDSTNYENLIKGSERAVPLPDSNLIEVEDKVTLKRKRRLTPTSEYAELVRYLATKQVFAYNDSDAVDQLIAEWKFNPVNKVMSEPMRQHFFNTILSKINPKELMESLLNSGIPFMYVYGEHDFTTPPPNETDCKQLQKYKSFFFKKYKGSVHYPSWETRSQNIFDNDVIDFLNRNLSSQMSSTTALRG